MRADQAAEGGPVATASTFEAVVIGAGPSGLAVARELEHHHGIKTLVIDRAAAPATSWRTRYDDFRLNTAGFMSHLPGQRIPVTAGRWPTKEDMVAYFDRYVRRQNIALRLRCEVNRIDPMPGGWQLDTSPGRIHAPMVVLATGNYRTPTIPPWPGLDQFTGEVIHSGDFTDAWPYLGRDVLVVGAGNSAADIAVQLAKVGAGRIWLAVRTPPHLVRRAMGPIPSDLFLELSARVPARVVDPLIAHTHRLMWGGDLSPYGFHRPPMGLKTTVEKTGRIPTMADALVDKVRAGRIQVVAAVTALERDRVCLADGSSVAPEVIIAATGFSSDLHGLIGHLDVLDERGYPRGGFASHLGNGLFAIGYGIPPSGPLRAIRLHATRLASEIAHYLTSTRTATANAATGSDAGLRKLAHMSVKRMLSPLRWSVINTFLFPRTFARTGQFGDGREKAVADYVVANARRGDIDDVLNTIDKFAYDKKFLINVGDEKGELLDAAVKRANTRLALELGTYCGYGALRIARAAPTAKVYSVEWAEANAQIARRIWAHAGVDDRVTCVVGTIGDGGRTLQALGEYGFHASALDLLFLDHTKSAYLSDLQSIIERGWLHPGSIVVADNVKIPGAPKYREYMRHQQGRRFETVEHNTHGEYQTLVRDLVLESVVLAEG